MITMKVSMRLIAIIAMFILFGGIFIIINQGYMISYIKTSSMEPTYCVGDIVIIRKVSPEAIHTGDVIVFREPGGPDLILHRVVAIKEEKGKRYFLTKGDNPRTNPYVDSWGWVPEENVIGVLVARVPHIGYIFLFFDTPGAKLMLILIVILFYVAYLNTNKKNDRELSPISIHLKAAYFRLFLLTAIFILILLMTLLCLTKTNRYSIAITEARTGEGYYINEKQYVVLLINIRSEISFAESINSLEITISRDNIYGSGSWTIRYPFYGEKNISIAILLNGSVISSSKQRFGIEFHVQIVVSIRNYLSGETTTIPLEEQTIWAQVITV